MRLSFRLRLVFRPAMSQITLLSNTFVDDQSAKIRAKEVPWPVRPFPYSLYPQLTAAHRRATNAQG